MRFNRLLPIPFFLVKKLLARAIPFPSAPVGIALAKIKKLTSIHSTNPFNPNNLIKGDLSCLSLK